MAVEGWGQGLCPQPITYSSGHREARERFVLSVLPMSRAAEPGELLTAEHPVDVRGHAWFLSFIRRGSVLER